MSQCLRYRDPAICDHLAAQYVSGAMSTRVRSRMETLLRYTPELNRAVAFWADQFSDLQSSLPEVSPSPSVWKNIESSLPERIGDVSVTVPWWRRLFLWQITSVVGLATSLLLVFALLVAPAPPQINAGPNYIAAMSPGTKNDDISLVISAYQKTQYHPSRLQFQWSENHFTEEVTHSLHLWAELRDSGQLIYIGVRPRDKKFWALAKPAWLAVANSRRLLVTSTEQHPSEQQVLFSGPCVQLKAWKI